MPHAHAPRKKSPPHQICTFVVLCSPVHVRWNAFGASKSPKPVAHPLFFPHKNIRVHLPRSQISETWSTRVDPHNIYNVHRKRLLDQRGSSLPPVCLLTLLPHDALYLPPAGVDWSGDVYRDRPVSRFPDPSTHPSGDDASCGARALGRSGAVACGRVPAPNMWPEAGHSGSFQDGHGLLVKRRGGLAVF